MVLGAPRHRVFVSYHHELDQGYRRVFDVKFAAQHDVIVDWSVELGDIDPGIGTERIRQRIRDEYLRDSTVTVVLVGLETWQRKYVDWEIYSSLRDTSRNPRSGLIGILLPSYRQAHLNGYDPHTLPPRLADNLSSGFAKLYHWTERPEELSQWVHEAFLRRDRILPNNARPMFARNRSGARWSD